VITKSRMENFRLHSLAGLISYYLGVSSHRQALPPGCLSSSGGRSGTAERSSVLVLEAQCSLLSFVSNQS
jgi:hypothetical protein